MTLWPAFVILLKKTIIDVSQKDEHMAERRCLKIFKNLFFLIKMNGKCYFIPILRMSKQKFVIGKVFQAHEKKKGDN